MPQTTKQVKRLIGILQFFKNYIPNLSEKLISFYKLLLKESKITTNEEHKDKLESLKTDLFEATKMTLSLPKPGLQYIPLCDASYYAAGFVLMFEDYVSTTSTKQKKTYAPVSFGSQLFNTAQLKFSPYYKEFLALYFALDQFAHFLWCSNQPVIVLTNNRSLTQFFQSKTIPPTPWNFLDSVLSFNLVIAHIPGRANYAAHFLSRMQTDRTASLSLKLSDKIEIKEFQIDTAAKSPDASLNHITSIDKILEEERNDLKFIEQLKEVGLYDAYLGKMKDVSKDEIVGLLKLTRQELNALQFENPLDVLTDRTERSDTLDNSRKIQISEKYGNGKKNR